jgi:hypothetical protein
MPQVLEVFSHLQHGGTGAEKQGFVLIDQCGGSATDDLPLFLTFGPGGGKNSPGTAGVLPSGKDGAAVYPLDQLLFLQKFQISADCFIGNPKFSGDFGHFYDAATLCQHIQNFGLSLLCQHSVTTFHKKLKENARVLVHFSMKNVELQGLPANSQLFYTHCRNFVRFVVENRETQIVR